jgi:hypothetical protein
MRATNYGAPHHEGFAGVLVAINILETQFILLARPMLLRGLLISRSPKREGAERRQALGCSGTRERGPMT